MTPETAKSLMETAIQAGARIMADWGRNGAVTRKTDGSPVTETDQAAEDIVAGGIRAVSEYPIIGEEAAHAGLLPEIGDGPFWLVDALDGTRDFIHGGKDFTVNIALIENGAPTFGVVYAPAINVLWHAIAGQGAFRDDARISMRLTPPDGYYVLGGKRSSEPFVIEPFIGPHVVMRREQRSSSLKFCLLADASADLYPRKGPTYEWDTAAGDIILREAGGAVLDLVTKKPLVYGKVARKFENEGFIAGSREAFKNMLTL